VVVREADAADMGTFYRLLDHTAQRAGLPIRSSEYYRQEWQTLTGPGRLKLFLALYEDKVLAMRMPMAFGGKAATLHSGSSDPMVFQKLVLPWAFQKLVPLQLVNLGSTGRVSRFGPDNASSSLPRPSQRSNEVDART
jgi:hypothetical protein